MLCVQCTLYAHYSVAKEEVLLLPSHLQDNLTRIQSSREVHKYCTYTFVGHCLATKVFISKSLATRGVWVIIE